MRGLTTGRSLPTARIISANGKNFSIQMQKADGCLRHYRDVSNQKFQKHERGMKKALSSWLMSEVVDPEVCHDITTDEVKAALRNINPTKAARPDKIHPRFLHHFLPGLHLPADEYLQLIEGGY